MATAQIVGGPHDGEWIEFDERSMYVYVAVPMDPTPAPVDPMGARVNEVRMVPMLTRSGYRLYWPRDAV